MPHETISSRMSEKKAKVLDSNTTFPADILLVHAAPCSVALTIFSSTTVIKLPYHSKTTSIPVDYMWACKSTVSADIDAGQPWRRCLR